MNKPNNDKIRRRLVKLAVLTILMSILYRANATDIDPRSYSNIPVGLNFLIAGYTYTNGNVSFSPSVPIKNGYMQINSAVLAYSRSLDIFGKSGKIDLILPGASLSGTAEVQGQPRVRDAGGFADPIARFYVNLYGAPALSMKEFAAYKQNLIIGASLAITAPWGQYTPDKLVNLGNNRWAFKPEIGISKAWGPLTTELAAGAYFFTDNDQPFTGKTLRQDPLYTAQGHLIYNIRPGIWGAFDANYYNGGGTFKDGVLAGEFQANWRVGGTFSFPVHKYHSIKLYGSTGIYSHTGTNFDIVGIAWLFRWGEGL
jgi:hypothetical protein